MYTRYNRRSPLMSYMMRSLHGWRCTICKANLVNYRKLLHVHHINGDCTDNRIENLRVLCKLCHAAESGHSHMMKQISGDELRTIEACRRLGEVDTTFEDQDWSE